MSEIVSGWVSAVGLVSEQGQVHCLMNCAVEVAQDLLVAEALAH